MDQLQSRASAACPVGPPPAPKPSPTDGALNNARDGRSGYIARTHEDLVALQKRGERNYYEFELNKSKQVQRVGPVRVSLRKADTKHKRFDVNLFVDDNELQKKSVNLYE